MTPKQQRFVGEFLVDLNATAAARGPTRLHLAETRIADQSVHVSKVEESRP